MTRWTIVALGVLAIAAALLLPWYTAHGVDGSADMAGWGAWSTAGTLDAALRPLPWGVFVCLPAGAMVFGGVRSAFGVTVVGAMTALLAIASVASIVCWVAMREKCCVRRRAPNSLGPKLIQ